MLVNERKLYWGNRSGFVDGDVAFISTAITTGQVQAGEPGGFAAFSSSIQMDPESYLLVEIL